MINLVRNALMTPEFNLSVLVKPNMTEANYAMSDGFTEYPESVI